MKAQKLLSSIFTEINELRTSPSSYIPKLETSLKHFEGSVLHRPNKIPIQTEEGPQAVREAISLLRSAARLPPLVWSDELAKVAQDHVQDIGSKGETGHISSDGADLEKRIEKYGEWELALGENIDYGNSSPEEIVFSWLVDDGIQDRQHRGNLLQTEFAVCGIGFGLHREFDTCCCIVFCAGFTPRVTSPVRSRTSPVKAQESPVRPPVQRARSGIRSPGKTRELRRLTPEDIQACKEAFEVFDSSGSGTVNPREIQRGLTALGDNRNNAILRLLTGIEKLGSAITLQDFLLHVDDNIGDRLSKEGIVQILRLYDEDNTGRISLQNVNWVAKELGETLTEDQLTAAFFKVSSNNRDISVDDFYQVLVKNSHI